MASWHAEPIAFHHFRDKDGAEVDIVLERGTHEVAGVEVCTDLPGGWKTPELEWPELQDRMLAVMIKFESALKGPIQALRQ